MLSRLDGNSHFLLLLLLRPPSLLQGVHACNLDTETKQFSQGQVRGLSFSVRQPIAASNTLLWKTHHDSVSAVIVIDDTLVGA